MKPLEASLLEGLATELTYGVLRWQGPLLRREASLVKPCVEEQACIGSLFLHLRQDLKRETPRVHALFAA